MDLLFWIWVFIWPLMCVGLFLFVSHQTFKNNRERVGWAETPVHPSFGLVIKKGQTFVSLQCSGEQFVFEDPDDLEKLLSDGTKQNERAMSMSALLDDSFMKSEVEKELESL